MKSSFLIAETYFLFIVVFCVDGRGGWSFLREQSNCTIVCENGGVCAFNTENPGLHKCICFVGLFWGERCEHPVIPNATDGPDEVLNDNETPVESNETAGNEERERENEDSSSSFEVTTNVVGSGEEPFILQDQPTITTPVADFVGNDIRNDDAYTTTAADHPASASAVDNPSPFLTQQPFKENDDEAEEDLMALEKIESELNADDAESTPTTQQRLSPISSKWEQAASFSSSLELVTVGGAKQQRKQFLDETSDRLVAAEFAGDGVRGGSGSRNRAPHRGARPPAIQRQQNVDEEDIAAEAEVFEEPKTTTRRRLSSSATTNSGGGRPPTRYQPSHQPQSSSSYYRQQHQTAAELSEGGVEGSESGSSGGWMLTRRGGGGARGATNNAGYSGSSTTTTGFVVSLLLFPLLQTLLLAARPQRSFFFLSFSFVVCVLLASC